MLLGLEGEGVLAKGRPGPRAALAPGNLSRMSEPEAVYLTFLPGSAPLPHLYLHPSLSWWDCSLSLPISQYLGFFYLLVSDRPGFSLHLPGWPTSSSSISSNFKASPCWPLSPVVMLGTHHTSPRACHPPQASHHLGRQAERARTRNPIVQIRKLSPLKLGSLPNTTQQIWN